LHWLLCPDADLLGRIAQDSQADRIEEAEQGKQGV
jgi:hypothetical protein